MILLQLKIYSRKLIKRNTGIMYVKTHRNFNFLYTQPLLQKKTPNVYRIMHRNFGAHVYIQVKVCTELRFTMLQEDSMITLTMGGPWRWVNIGPKKKPSLLAYLPGLAVPRHLNQNSFIQGINWSQNLPCIDHLRTTYLGSSVQVHLVASKTSLLRVFALFLQKSPPSTWHQQVSFVHLRGLSGTWNWV